MVFNKNLKLLLALFVSLFLSGCETNYLDYSQHVESPDGRFNYCLYFDAVGSGDPGYYILELDKSINPEKLIIPWSFKNGISTKDSEWIRKKQVLFNYDEAGLFTSNPKIEIIDKRFLVFSRGDYYFGLYDLQLRKDTFNISSPWHAWLSQSNWNTNNKHDEKKEKAAYGLWIQKNLNDKIKDYIISNK